MALIGAPLRDENPPSAQGNQRRIQRTPEQERARVYSAKLVRQSPSQPGSPHVVRPAANDTDQNESGDYNRTQVAQARVERLRQLRAQVITGAEEETQNQIIQAENEKPSAIRYIPAATVAFFKDILDFTLIGSLPVIGTVISFFCAVLIFLLLLFTKANGSLLEMQFILRRLILIIATFVIEGFVFGVNFLPVQLGVVILIFFMDRHLSEKQITFLKNIAEPLSKKRL